MIDRKTIRDIAATLGAAALLLAGAGPADSGPDKRSPVRGASTTKQGHASPNLWPGGPQWYCYWHPYACRYRR